MRKLLGSTATALFALGALAVSLPQPAFAGDVTPPPVPSDVQVPAGSIAFLVGHAIGTQNYICLPSGRGFAWALFTPQATLFDDQQQQVITHFFSPNPFEEGKVRATWQHSRDTSTVWGQVVGQVTVTPGAIPWLLVQIEKIGAQDGPTGGDTLTATSFVQRLNTTGGVAPPTGCASFIDVGKKAFVPYTADYFFYRNADGE